MGMSDLNERLNQLEQGALNLLFPRKCPFCNRHIGGRDLICGDCEKTLPYTGDRARRQVSGLRVAAPLYYEDAVRRALLDFKFKGRMGGLPCFGSLMARCAAEEFGGEFDAITWVPVAGSVCAGGALTRPGIWPGACAWSGMWSPRRPCARQRTTRPSPAWTMPTPAGPMSWAYTRLSVRRTSPGSASC